MLKTRTPSMEVCDGPLIWSKIPEFSMTYVGASAIIPYVEFYLNDVMNTVMTEHCADNAKLKDELKIFIDQENQHAKYHHRYNKRLFDTIPELKAVADAMTAHLTALRKNRSIAFNAAYCAGFESIATFDSIYLHERCAELLEGADPHGANLVMWHVAEEFEHRAVCHDAYRAVSGSYLLRCYTTLYAFWHIGGAFMRAEAIIREHFFRQMSTAEHKQSAIRSRQLFRRHMRYLVPHILKIFVPGYNPADLPTPPQITSALEYFGGKEPIHDLVGRA